MLKEFKEFALKGNVMDLAIGIIIGAAFGKIVTSLVNDLIMPVIGFLTAGIDFTELKIVLSAAEMDAAGELIKPEVALMYGNFIQTAVDFVIITFSIFIVIRMINKMKRQKEAEPASEPPAGPTETELLTEIRDLIKKD
ncbi:MAG: large-conductance mechanosensitive channel protein MscL [Methanosarcina sp.]|nr:large-conductance mechanosensitive channel protein MscL [Methanosarcina sp.]